MIVITNLQTIAINIHCKFDISHMIQIEIGLFTPPIKCNYKAQANTMNNCKHAHNEKGHIEKEASSGWTICSCIVTKHKPCAAGIKEEMMKASGLVVATTSNIFSSSNDNNNGKSKRGNSDKR